MSIIKPTTAYPTGANWPSASSRGYQTDQVALCVDTVADVNDNDFERVRFVFVKSKASFYRLDLSSGAADDADTVLLDNQGRRYIKIVGSAGTLSWDALAEDITARGAYDDEAEGFTVLVIDSGDGRSAVYVMGDGGSADWSDPIYLTSIKGDTGTSITPQGAYDGGTTYATGALVSYSGRAFISSQDGNVGNTPPTSDTDSAYWMFLPGGLYGGIPSPNDYDAIGSGSDDDKGSFDDIEVAGIGRIRLPDGNTYLISDDITISPVVQFEGGLLKPASGKTITFAEVFHNPGPEQLFDMSAGGSIVCAAGQVLHPENFGAVQNDPSTGSACDQEYLARSAVSKGGEIVITQPTVIDRSARYMFDEDTPAGANNRHFGIRLRGPAGYGVNRLGSNAQTGPCLIMKNGVAADVLQIVGVRRSVDQPSRCGMVVDNVPCFGNLADMVPASKTFDAATAVDTGNDELDITGHGFVTGQPVQYIPAVEHSGARATIVGGLTGGEDYYAIRVDADNLGLATSYANAVAGTKVDLTSGGTGTHTIQARSATIVTFDASSDVDTGADTLTVTGHPFVTGSRVIYRATAAGAITGLTDGTTYAVIVVDANTIKLATTVAFAEAGTAINLTAASTGTHMLRPYCNGVYLESVKDVYGALEGHNCAGDAVGGNPLGGMSCNVVKVSAGGFNCTGKGLWPAGWGDSLIHVFHIGRARDTSARFDGGCNYGHGRIYLGDKEGVVAYSAILGGSVDINDMGWEPYRILGTSGAATAKAMMTGKIDAKLCCLYQGGGRHNAAFAVSSFVESGQVELAYDADDQGDYGIDLAPANLVYTTNSTGPVNFPSLSLAGAVTDRTVYINGGSSAIGKMVANWVPPKNRLDIAYAASITIDPGAAKRHVIATVTGNLTFANPGGTRFIDGYEFEIYFTLDGTGLYTLTIGGQYEGPAGETTTTLAALFDMSAGKINVARCRIDADRSRVTIYQILVI